MWFFSGVGDSASELTDRIHEVAYFWRMSPLEVEAMTLDRFLVLEAQASRVSELINP